MNNKNKRINVVYSTNTNFNYEYIEKQEQDTLPEKQQNLKVILDKKQRNGKIVTLVSGFIGKQSDLEQLGKFLKTKCGVGGTIKENEILIQGNFLDKVITLLKEAGYNVKKSGG